MSHVVYRCTACGWKDWDDGGCPLCGCTMEAYEAGPPQHEEGMPNVIGDELRPVFDNAAGRSFTSKSERRRFYEKHDLRRVSVAEYRRHNPGMDHGCMNTTFSYSGQQDRRTASERRPNTKGETRGR